jgi:atlastin
MGDGNEPLSGFSWRSGSERETTGVLMWSDVFLATKETTGEKLAIIVTDTQGLFDNESTVKENTRIFALSTLISSMQVLNLSNNIKENELEYLQFATEFANFVADNTLGEDSKPFQNLLFLIRDWENDKEYAFGFNGGDEYVNKILAFRTDQAEELQLVRQRLKSMYEKLGCCLLPYPGKKVARGNNFFGEWNSMDEDFMPELKNSIETLLNLNALVPKRVNGKALKASEFKGYLVLYFESFLSDNLPEPKSLGASMIDAQMITIIDNCIEKYQNTRDQYRDKLTLRNLDEVHMIAEENALNLFDDERKMGTAKQHEMFRAKLVQMIHKYYLNWHEMTESHLKLLKQMETQGFDRQKIVQLQIEHHEKLKDTEKEMKPGVFSLLFDIVSTGAKKVIEAVVTPVVFVVEKVVDAVVTPAVEFVKENGEKMVETAVKFLIKQVTQGGEAAHASGK